MKKILLTVLLFSLMVCGASPAWAGGMDDANAGLAALNGGNYDEAIRLYTKAIASGELSQDYLSIAYINRGRSWYFKKDFDKAIADFTKAIEIDPKDADAYYARGLVRHIKGDYDKAIADYTKVIEINPKRAKAYKARGFCWEAKGQYDKAKADYAKAKEIDPSIR